MLIKARHCCFRKSAYGKSNHYSQKLYHTYDIKQVVSQVKYFFSMHLEKIVNFFFLKYYRLHN